MYGGERREEKGNRKELMYTHLFLDKTQIITTRGCFLIVYHRSDQKHSLTDFYRHFALKLMRMNEKI